MILRLTTGQLGACISAGSSQLVHDLERGEVERRPGTVDVRMPYIAWVALREALYDVVFNTRGYQDRGVPVRYVNALKRVAAGCNWWAQLPPLKGAGMLGWQPLIIPVWAMNGGWMPYPIEHAWPYVLRPQWLTQNGTKLTTWSSEDVAAADEHWSLRDEAFRPYVDVARRELDLTLLVDRRRVQPRDVHGDAEPAH